MKACERVSIPTRHEAAVMEALDGNHEWWGFNLTSGIGLTVIVQRSALKLWGNPENKPIPPDKWLVGGVFRGQNSPVYTAMELLETLSEYGFSEVFARPDFILEL
jgi:hypothetical protein